MVSHHLRTKRLSYNHPCNRKLHPKPSLKTMQLLVFNSQNQCAQQINNNGEKKKNRVTLY